MRRRPLRDRRLQMPGPASRTCDRQLARGHRAPFAGPHAGQPLDADHVRDRGRQVRQRRFNNVIRNRANLVRLSGELYLPR